MAPPALREYKKPFTSQRYHIPLLTPCNGPGPQTPPLALTSARILRLFCSGVALCGTLGGQLLFGYLGDQFGRKAVYGERGPGASRRPFCKPELLGRDYSPLLTTPPVPTLLCLPHTGLVLAIMIMSAIAQSMSFGTTGKAVIGTLCFFRCVLRGCSWALAWASASSGVHLTSFPSLFRSSAQLLPRPRRRR